MSKRTDFEAALVEHLSKMMYWVAEKRGGVNEILNDFLFTVDDPQYMSDQIEIILDKKREADSELSSEYLDVSIMRVTLNAQLLAEWTYWVKLGYDDELANAWHIHAIAITINANQSYRIFHCAITDINFKRFKPKVNDPLWDYFRTLVNGETYIKIANFSKQIQL